MAVPAVSRLTLSVPPGPSNAEDQMLSGLHGQKRDTDGGSAGQERADFEKPASAHTAGTAMPLSLLRGDPGRIKQGALILSKARNQADFGVIARDRGLAGWLGFLWQRGPRGLGGKWVRR